MAGASRASGADALDRTLRNHFRKFPDRGDSRYKMGMIFPSAKPSFQIARGDSVFTIGSCFARNVEEDLIALGLDVPTAHFKAPYDEAPGRSNRVLNQYNPGTMLQCVEAVERGVLDGGLYEVESDNVGHSGSDLVVDALLATGGRPVTRARAIERRKEIADLYRSGLNLCSLVVVTLGLTEVWYDHKHEIYLNEMPPQQLIRAEPHRFEFRRLDVSECQTLLSRMIEALQRGKRRNVLLSLSPVPLQVSFGCADSVIANSYSKAVLRVVAEMVSTKFDMVDYFPSYEIAASNGLNSFEDDNVHVKPMIVRHIVTHMLEHYVATQH